MAKFTDLFHEDCEEVAQKYLDYYDGEQKEWVKQHLKRIRFSAYSSGMLEARFRNIVKMVVDKSGMLFNNKPPVLEVYTGDTVSEAESARLMDLMESADWIEFFTNLDPVVRMLKTCIVLVGYVPEEDRLTLTLLSQHNAAVSYDEMTKKVNMLVYKTGYTDEGKTYRVWSPELVQDITVLKHSGEERIDQVVPNPYGIIPMAAFHDTNTPREGFWNDMSEDLIEINDIYNVALSDSEYSAAWAKYETLFTNATVEGSDELGIMMPMQVEGEPLPRLRPAIGPSAVGGPGKVIQLDTNGVASPFVEYKGPKPDLAPLDAMVQKWVVDFASDWSVNANADVNAADSGFKLVVKEMPNLELRKKRQRMMEAGFKRLFQVIKVVVGGFSAESQLFASFGAPELPIDEKATEEVWSRRIAEKRASRVDYFKAVHGMSEAEALAKIAAIDAEAPITPNRSGPPVVTTVTV